MAGEQNPPSVSNTPEALGPMQQINNTNNLTGRPSIHPSLHQPCLCMYVYPQQRQKMKHKGEYKLPNYCICYCIRKLPRIRST